MVDRRKAMGRVKVRKGGEEYTIISTISRNSTPLLITRSVSFPSLFITRIKVRMARERNRIYDSSFRMYR
jgi:hypothetical protein